MEITKFEQLDLSKTYSYFDYLKWKFEERVELIKGKVLQMSPAPASKHQRISNRISSEITFYLKGNPCQVFYAPFDVRLERLKDDKKVINVVQPDICVICDLNKIDERGCVGAPELVIEILTPGNSHREMSLKFDLYESAGVEEYWIVDPEKETILQYFSEKGKFINYRPLAREHSISSKVVEGFQIPLEEIFKSS